jgi:biopolymer transport protein TolR
MASIDVSAFASILVVLLALWMLPARIFADLPVHGVTADLPKVGHPIPVPHARREDAILIAIMRNGDIFFLNERVRSYTLAGRIRTSVKNGSERVVYIRADARAKYRSVEDVLDEVRSSGVQHVVFVVDQRRSSVPQ